MVKRMIGVIFLSWAVALSGAGAAGLEFAVGGWQQDLSGTIGYEALSSADLTN